MRGSHFALNLLQSPKTEKTTDQVPKITFQAYSLFFSLVIPPDENQCFMYTHLTQYAATMGVSFPYF